MKIKYRYIVLLIVVVLGIYGLYYVYNENSYWDYVSTDLIDKTSEEYKVCKFVDEIVDDINKNNGKLSKKYQDNVANDEIVKMLYRYDDFDKLDYNEIKGLVVKEGPFCVLLKNTKESDFKKQVEFENARYASYRNFNNVIDSNICIYYTISLISKKDQKNYEYNDRAIGIEKGETINLFDNQLYIHIKGEDENLIITDVKVTHKINLKSMYDFIKTGKMY